MSRLDEEAAGVLWGEGQEAVTGRPGRETATGRPRLAGRTAPGQPGWGVRVATGRPVQGGLGCRAEEVITFRSGGSLEGGYRKVTGMRFGGRWSLKKHIFFY